MTGEAFRAYVEQVLAPELEPGDAVVMDNLSTHKVPGVEEAIRAVGASVLYLPSYSPDLNPIEQLLAKLKALLRKAAARTQDALWETIGTSLDAFTPEECQNYIVNSGYEFAIQDMSSPKSLFECAISRTYAISDVSALSLDLALAGKAGSYLLA